MTKRKEKKLTGKELEMANEVMDEVKEEIREETPQRIRERARRMGIYSIVAGMIAILAPHPFSIVIGFVALIFARDSVTKGEKLGRIGAVLGFIAVFWFLVAAGMNAAHFGT